MCQLAVVLYNSTNALSCVLVLYKNNGLAEGHASVLWCAPPLSSTLLYFWTPLCVLLSTFTLWLFVCFCVMRVIIHLCNLMSSCTTGLLELGLVVFFTEFYKYNNVSSKKRTLLSMKEYMAVRLFWITKDCRDGSGHWIEISLVLITVTRYH